MRRRSFVLAASSVLSGLAGCSVLGGGDSDDDSGTDVNGETDGDGEADGADAAGGNDGSGGGGGRTRPPDVNWESSEQVEDGETTALRFVHGGGDVVQTERLRVEVNGQSASPGTQTTVAAGNAIVAALDGDGEAPSLGDDVQLLWSADEGGNGRPIVQHVLNQGTPAGSLAGEFTVE